MTTQTTAAPQAQLATAADRGTVILTAVKPTGELHLGNYVGAIRPFARLAGARSREVYVFVADLHALNTRPDPAVSVPSAKLASPSATATAEPELDPPAM